ncbi:hypothetical protein [Pseudomonas aeruginosa]
MSKVILKVESLVKDFTIRHNRGGMKHKLAGLFNPRFQERIETLRAVNDVSFTLCKGESGVWGAMEPKTNVSSESHRKGAFRSPAHPPGITL